MTESSKFFVALYGGFFNILVYCISVWSAVSFCKEGSWDFDRDLLITHLNLRSITILILLLIHKHERTLHLIRFLISIASIIVVSIQVLYFLHKFFLVFIFFSNAIVNRFLNFILDCFLLAYGNIIDLNPFLYRFFFLSVCMLCSP